MISRAPLAVIIHLLCVVIYGQDSTQAVHQDARKLTQREIIQKHFLDPVKQYGFYSVEVRHAIDNGLQQDSTIAFLWQKKSELLLKKGKYEIGMKYLDKAVHYDTINWLAYRGFMKCIFAHQYQSAIVDFAEAKRRFGDGYIMDHTYNFHIALCHLQLNHFSQAETIFEKEIKRIESEKGFDWVHHLDLYYLGICKYELQKYKEAIATFDLALGKYPEFSDVQFYKAICLKRLGKPEESESIHKLAVANGRKGFTINEDNVVYVRYPYQINWDKY